MGRLSATNQLIIAIALVVIVAVAAVLLGIMPKFQQTTEIMTQIETEQANLVTAQALVARRQSAKAQSAANEVELLRIANQIPDSPQLPSVIIDLQDVANETGLAFPQFSVGGLSDGPAAEDGTPGGYSILPVNLTLRGDWTDVIEYNHRLNELDRAVRVKNTSFGYNAGSEDEDPYITVTMSLEVYVMEAASGSMAPTAAGDTTAP